jgi:hypothetical protein
MTFKFLKTVLTTCRYVMCISFGVLSVSGTASATLIDSIAALDEGARYRVLFVTTDKTDASSGYINDYNAFVRNAAVSGIVTGSLGLTWSALASTGRMLAQSNTMISPTDISTVTMFDTSGQIVARSGKDLWDGWHDQPIASNEDGIGMFAYVWTGIGDGSYFGDRPLGEGQAWVGTSGSNSEDSVFRSRYEDVHTFSASMYAVSSVAVKTLTDVPEPSTIMLLSLGLAGLSFSRYRKQS